MGRSRPEGMRPLFTADVLEEPAPHRGGVRGVREGPRGAVSPQILQRTAASKEKAGSVRQRPDREVPPGRRIHEVLPGRRSNRRCLSAGGAGGGCRGGPLGSCPRPDRKRVPRKGRGG